MNDQTVSEEWRDIPNFGDAYAVSNFGRIKRTKPGPRTHVGRILKQTMDRWGYLLFRANEPALGKEVGRNTHRVVAAAFIGPCPMGHQVNHKNGIKTDNRAENLEYMTQSQNIRHAIDVLGVEFVPPKSYRKTNSLPGTRRNRAPRR